MFVKQDGVENVQFLLHNAEKDKWAFPNKFDYIHFRYVISLFPDTPGIIKKAYDNLTPGGWVEFFDLECIHHYFDEANPRRSAAMDEWIPMSIEAGKTIGVDVTKSANYKRWMKEAGFVDVVDHIFKAPSNSWPKHPTLKTIGGYQLETLVASMKTLDKFILLTGIDQSLADRLLPRVIEDMANLDYHIWYPLYVFLLLPFWPCLKSFIYLRY